VKPEERSDEEMTAPLNSRDSKAGVGRQHGGPPRLGSCVNSSPKQTEKDVGSASEIASVEDDECWVMNLEEHRPLKERCNMKQRRSGGRHVSPVGPSLFSVSPVVEML
jgi:hypothetical protein